MKIKKIYFDDLVINTISHISDTHIRTYKRHKEYNLVFNKLYKSLIENPTDLIVVSGDVVHSKTEMSPELIDITSLFFKRLSEIGIVLLFPGNHDTNLNNLNRMDALTPIVKNLNLNNLIYIKKSGIYKIGNIYFIHMSVFDNPNEYIKANQIKNLNPKIALYHGVVDNATSDYGYRMKSDIMNLSLFTGYDLVLLGDIHKTQNLQNYNIEKMVIDESNLNKYLEMGWLISE